MVAGAAPSLNHPDAQRWGMPVFDWPAHAATGFAWWCSRLDRELELFDVLRIDHFRGLVKFWAIPADKNDPRDGFWRDGPGMAFFDAARRHLGGLPLIVEDLGFITPDVVELRETLGLPGMTVVARASDDEWRTDSVLCTSTHDSDTLAGWWKRWGREHRADLAAGASGPADEHRAVLRSIVRLEQRARDDSGPGSARARERGTDEPAGHDRQRQLEMAARTGARTPRRPSSCAI